MFGRTRYQQGSLQRVERKTGPDCWVFRWRDVDGQGIRHRRKLVVGTVADYPTASSAEAAVAALRMNINVEASRAAGQPISIRDLIAHYKETELKLEPAGDDPGETEKAYSTKQTYRPLTRVRQSAKRVRIPGILEVGEFQSLLQELALRERLLVALDATTGLRRSELTGLKWGDVDFDSLTISVTRSAVSGVVGVCKTETSRKSVPLVSAVALLKANREGAAQARLAGSAAEAPSD